MSEGQTRTGARRWVAIVLLVGALHVAVLAYLLPDSNVILDGDFGPDAEAVLDGVKPYSGIGFEYPPLALPVLLAPAAVSDSPAGYRKAFGWEMIGFDLAIVALLAFALRVPERRRLEALGIYSAGVLLLSLTKLGTPTFALGDDPVAIARFDLVPAALTLAALLARQAARTATWSGLLSVATAVKAFPVLLAPPLLRGQGDRLTTVAIAAVIPLGLAAAIVAGFGDDLGSAISYHAERDLQLEALAATPFLVAHQLGAGASTAFGAGGINVVATGTDAARLASLVLLGTGYLAVVAVAWRRRPPLLETAVAILALAVVLAPVLSPQFLLWVLPVSAAAFGLGAENLVLLAAFCLTRVMLDNYDAGLQLGGAFVWPAAIRNGLLLLYLGLVLRRLRSPSGGRPVNRVPL